MNIGTFEFSPAIALAPMAGISDLPFRNLCRDLGADYAVGEMVTAKTGLWSSRKSRNRLRLEDTRAPRIVQIAGADPEQLADAARALEARGADVVDINMGCPAKKVCNRLAGSALLADEALVADILHAVCGAVAVPVTLKIRTGPTPATRNGVRIAHMAADAGVAALAVHGRTRACAFRGAAEYQTIRAIKRAVDIPVLANGDITNATQALAVLDTTAADGVLIGRGALGNPWIFDEIRSALAGRQWRAPGAAERVATLAALVAAMHTFYGADHGLRIARKHAGWFLERLPQGLERRRTFNRIEHAPAQLAYLDDLRRAVQSPAGATLQVAA